MRLWWMLSLSSALAQEGGQCATSDATASFQAGFQAQQSLKTGAALGHYEACLQSDPRCVPCLYEVGWTYWSRSDWASVVST